MAAVTIEFSATSVSSGLCPATAVKSRRQDHKAAMLKGMPKRYYFPEACIGCSDVDNWREETILELRAKAKNEKWVKGTRGRSGVCRKSQTQRETANKTRYVADDLRFQRISQSLAYMGVVPFEPFR